MIRLNCSSCKEPMIGHTCYKCCSDYLCSKCCGCDSPTLEAYFK